MFFGIYFAYTLSTLLVLGVWGSIFYKKADPSFRKWMVVLFLLQLPMSLLTFEVVRVPLDHWYSSLVGKPSLLYVILKSFEAPLTEEPAKLWPLLLPFIFNKIFIYKSRPYFVTATVVSFFGRDPRAIYRMFAPWRFYGYGRPRN